MYFQTDSLLSSGLTVYFHTTRAIVIISHHAGLLALVISFVFLCFLVIGFSVTSFGR